VLKKHRKIPHAEASISQQSFTSTRTQGTCSGIYQIVSDFKPILSPKKMQIKKVITKPDDHKLFSQCFNNYTCLWF